MILDLDWWVAAACLLIMAIGASVQATIGIGMGMLAAPVLGLADPAFLPATIMISVLPLSTGVAMRDWDAVNWEDVRTAFTGRVPGIAIGAVFVALTGPRAVAVVVALSVLTAVAASLPAFGSGRPDATSASPGCSPGSSAPLPASEGRRWR